MKEDATKLGDFLKALETGEGEDYIIEDYVILVMFNSLSQFSKDNFLKCYQMGLILPLDVLNMVEILGGDLDGVETAESIALRREVEKTIPSRYVFELAKQLFEAELTETECGCIWYHSPECRKTHFERARIAYSYFRKYTRGGL